MGTAWTGRLQKDAWVTPRHGIGCAWVSPVLELQKDSRVTPGHSFGCALVLPGIPMGDPWEHYEFVQGFNAGVPFLFRSFRMKWSASRRDPAPGVVPGILHSGLQWQYVPRHNPGKKYVPMQ